MIGSRNTILMQMKIELPDIDPDSFMNIIKKEIPGLKIKAYSYEEEN